MLGSLDHKTTLFSDTSPYSPTYGSSGDWKPLQTLSDHRHYVQGASFDPLGTYAATQGSDRTVVVMQRRPPKAVKPKKESKKVALSESTKDNAAATFTSSSSPPPPPSRQDNPSNDAENVSSGNTAEEVSFGIGAETLTLKIRATHKDSPASSLRSSRSPSPRTSPPPRRSTSF